MESYKNSLGLQLELIRFVQDLKQFVNVFQKSQLLKVQPKLIYSYIDIINGNEQTVKIFTVELGLFNIFFNNLFEQLHTLPDAYFLYKSLYNVDEYDSVPYEVSAENLQGNIHGPCINDKKKLMYYVCTHICNMDSVENYENCPYYYLVNLIILSDGKKYYKALSG